MNDDPWAGPVDPEQFQAGIPCQGECEGENKATLNVIVGHTWRHGERENRTKPMCHECALKEQLEKEWGRSS
jgi:hypothetical protein